MFWIAAALSISIGGLIVIVMFMLLSTPRTGTGWVWTVGFFLIGTWMGFVVLSLGLNTARGVQRGVEEADAARGDRREAHGRRAGKVVGTGLAKVTGRSKPSTTTSAVADTSATTGSDTTAPDSADSEPPTSEPKPSFDDAARSIGMMVGRRLGARKDRS